MCGRFGWKQGGWQLVGLLVVTLWLAACGSSNNTTPSTPVITTQPADVSVAVGDNASFSVTATGESPTYQWQDSVDDGANWSNITGATATSYSLTGVALSDSGHLFRVLVTAAGATVASSPAHLTVTAVADAPAITVQPTDQTVTELATASFSVTATGTSLQYQWQLSGDGGTSWSDIGGANSNNYTTPATALSDSGEQFRVQVSNGAGSVTSSTATLAVNAVATSNTAPAFTVLPTDLAVVVGAAATFSTSVTGTPTPSLQWQRSTNSGTSWTDIAGANSNNYTTPTAVIGDDGAQFRVVATNSAGSATSNAVTLTVAIAPSAPVFITQPADASVNAGSSAHFSAAASGTPTPTFQWQLSTDGGMSWNNINGATASGYDTPATVAGDSGRQYRAVASNSEAAVNSDAAVLTVSVELTATVHPVSAGDYHTCALKANGTASCWGSNANGQLGTGDTTDSLVPAAVTSLTGTVLAVAAGDAHSCALISDGSAACWGHNNFGQLGAGNTTDSTTPVAVSGLSNAVAISTGFNFSCALKADATVACWGLNGSGNLGDGTTTTRTAPVAVSGLTNAVAIATGFHHSCALKANGTVACWGENVHGELGDGSGTNRSTPVAASGLTNATAIATGDSHSCALRTDGTVVCWGDNSLGRLGDGTLTNRFTPTMVSGLSDVVAITAGGAFSCALKTDGTVACWGHNLYGQLGNGSTTEVFTTPVAVSGLSDATVLASGSWHSCALKADYAMVCWGLGGHGELGNNDVNLARTPEAVVGGAIFWQ